MLIAYRAKSKGVGQINKTTYDIAALQAEIWTALPGIVESYDPARQTAVVRLAVQGEITDEGGYSSYMTLPLLPNVPVEFPAGGGFTLTFPVKKGDECVVEFQARDISGWKQSGGMRPPLSGRMHDLTDAVCRVGVRSRARLLAPAPDAAAVELRSDDGLAKISMSPDKCIKLENPLASLLMDAMGNITLSGLNIAINAAGVFSVSAATGANIASGGNVLINGAEVKINEG